MMFGVNHEYVNLTRREGYRLLDSVANGPVARLHDREDGRSRFLVTSRVTASDEAWDALIDAFAAHPDWEVEAHDQCNSTPDYRFLIAAANDPDEAESALSAIVESVEGRARS